MLFKIKSKIIFLFKKYTFSPIKYWEDRAQKYGGFSVINLNHSADEIISIKKNQIETIFPLLKNELKGNEKMLLDFGCGPGRFCMELAGLTHCQVVGVDPIKYLLQLAPVGANISYKQLYDNIIPADDESFDIIWICLVLGGIVNEKKLDKTLNELKRVSKKNTLLFLIENTTSKKNILHWHYRTIQEYTTKFKDFNLKHLQDYDDMGETISIFSGRNTGQ